MTTPRDAAQAVQDPADAQSVALRVIAGLMVVGAAWLMAGLLVPFFLALVLAIALSPVATRMVRNGVPNVLASALCMLAVAAVLAVAAGLILFQAGTIIRDSDRYMERFSTLLAEAAQRTGGDRMAETFGLLETDGEEQAVPDSEGSPGDEGQSAAAPASGGNGTSNDAAATWGRFLRRQVRELGALLATGLGGLVGLLAGVVLFLAFLLYMLITRQGWIDRLTAASARLGLRPRRRELLKVQQEMVTYIGCLALVSLGYAVVVTLILWAVGVPQPLLWGVMAGLLEAVPYFGPLIAGVLPTIVSLSLGSWWQPAVVVAQYAGLHAFEGYVVTPLLYGRATEFNAVTILFGALFFGWIWGPLGIALAMPMMILLRGLLAITPDTPALDALADVEGEKSRLQDAPAQNR